MMSIATPLAGGGRKVPGASSFATAPLRTRSKQGLKKVLFQLAGVVRRLGGPAPNSVLLTFDDGPHPDVTPYVLDQLRAFKARAVFFVVGERVGQHPEVVRRIVSEGHLLGNHTYWHRSYGLGQVAAVRRDIRRCQEIVHDVTGHRPFLFRPPRGKITLGNLLAPPLLQLRTIYWSVDPADYRLRAREEAVVRGQQLAESVRGRDIVLLHDANPCVRTVLEVLLERLVDRGLELHKGLTYLSRVFGPPGRPA